MRCGSGGGWSALLFREWTSVDISFQNGHIKTWGEEKNRRWRDQIRVFLYLKWVEIKVAYGEMYLTAMEMKCMTWGIAVARGTVCDPVHVADDWGTWKNEAKVMQCSCSEYGRAIRASTGSGKVREKGRDRGRQRWAFLMLRLGEPRGNLTRLRSGRHSKRETLDSDVNPSLH